MNSVAGSLVATVLAVAAVVSGCGGDEERPEAPCPTFADVVESPDGDDGPTEFIVGLQPGLVTDGAARSEALADAGRTLCLDLTEVRDLALDAVLVDAGRLFDEAGQGVVVAALEGIDGVRYAEVNGRAYPQ